LNLLTFETCRKLGKYLEKSMLLLKWKYTQRSGHLHSNIAHLLAVKNPDYIRVAEIAIGSFLYHNPYSKVIIHCDKVTFPLAEKAYKYWVKKHKIEIVRRNEQFTTWQEQKIALLVEIANKKENFYIDCDVRWNGPLELPISSSFYVDEFPLNDKSPFRELVSVLGITSEDVHMLNTTFVYLHPGNFSDFELRTLTLIFKEINEACRENLVAKNDVEQVSRLAEQIAFSIFAKNSRRKFMALKKSDGHMDGSFLESSYFGATGAEF